MREHDSEPVPGLPERPPAGEAILWQGSPDWRTVARHVFHVRLLAVYIGGLWALSAFKTLSASVVETAALLQLAEYFGMAVAAMAVVTGFAWLIARTTIYTVTSRRVVLRYGIALSKTINLPFALIDGASLRVPTGDVALQLRTGNRVAFLVLWPHARPWRLARSEPMLRSLRDAPAVAQILSRALAASAEQPAQPVRLPAPAGTPAGRAVAA